MEWIVINWNVDDGKVAMIISVLSAAVSLLSFAFAIYSWKEANRPLVSARVVTVEGGNQAITLKLLVENTGNRPAKNIRLVAKAVDVIAALKVAGPIPTDAQRVFFSQVSIALLIHGHTASNAFGHLGRPGGSWRSGAQIPIKIFYENLDGRSYCTKLRLLLADDAGFAQTFWASEDKKYEG